MHLKFIARWLFGKRYGATMLISPATECGIKNHELEGLSIRGRVQGANLLVQTGKKEGGWNLTPNRVPGTSDDVILAEKALPHFINHTLTKAGDKTDMNLFMAAKLLDLIDFKKLRADVSRRLLDPNWHMRVDPDDENVIALEEWVLAEWASVPEHGSEGNQEEAE